MQIVIDISPEAMEDIKNDRASRCFLENKILNGTLLQEAKWQKKKIEIKKIEYGQTYITEWQVAQCSNCKRWHTTPYMYYFYEYKYCPFCGARMTESEEDDECR